jgi:hypothetical protein
MANRMYLPEKTTLDQTHNGKSRPPRPLTLILLALAFIALLHFIAVTHAGGPGPSSGNTCTALIHTTDYTKIIPHVIGTQAMSAIQFSNQLTGGQPSALVRVKDSGPQDSLDVYVYTCILHQQKPALVLLFKQQGLLQGSAEITPAHTLSIGQLDTTLPTDDPTLLLTQQTNVYQEYNWQNGTLQQTLFPGLYPVVSRSDAEALQQQANNGQSMLWQDPVATCEQMGHDLFQWKQSRGILQDNNGSVAHVLLLNSAGFSVEVGLTRLVQQNAAGLWFVTSASTTGISIQRNAQNLLSPSPFTIQGTISPGAYHLHATLFDHTLGTIPVLDSSTVSIQKNASYIGTITFGDTFQDQPGLLLLQAPPTSSGGNDGRLLLTNLIII